MGISGAAGNLSEESKKALRSETWQAVREGIKEKREVRHFTAELTAGADNAYGCTWDQVVKEYLKSGYNAADSNPDIVVMGETYKTMKRQEVTVFYDATGNTLFDVTNERLEKEYEWLMGDGADQDSEKADGELPDVQAEPEPSLEESTEADQLAGKQEDAEKPADFIKDKKNAEVNNDEAEAKLKSEFEKAKEKDFAEPVIEYLMERCRESGSLAADICQTHKTWEKCYDYIFEQARKKLSGKSGLVRNDVVYEWAEDYYHLDDKALEEKKAKEEADRKKKATEKKKEPEKKQDATAKRSSKKAAPAQVEKKEVVQKQQQEAPKQKPKKDELEGQMDLFSLMGM